MYQDIFQFIGVFVIILLVLRTLLAIVLGFFQTLKVLVRGYEPVNNEVNLQQVHIKEDEQSLSK
jgi:hypothetical protein